MTVVYIYGLVDPRNDKIFYIGFTANLKKRYNVHLNVDGYRREKNLYKDNVIRKILKLGLKPQIITLDSYDKIFNAELKMYEHERMEIDYIKKYREAGVKLTNLTTGGDGGCTRLKKVYQYSEEGKFLKEYDSVNDVASHYSVGADIISKAIDQRGKKSYRTTYLFSSKEKAKTFIFVKTRKCQTPVSQYSLDGKFIRSYDSQHEATRITGINQSIINNTLNNVITKAGNFYWYYTDNVPSIIPKYLGKSSKLFKPIIQYDLNNNIIDDFKSISEAGRCLNIKSNLIVTNLKGITKTCKGFVFKYKNKT